MKKSDLLLFLIILVFSQKGFTQISVTDAASLSLTPVELIESNFLGEGIEVLDVQFEGSTQSIGLFSNSLDHLEVSNGIVLSTGRINIPGGTNIGNESMAFADSENGSSAQDSDMNILSNGVVGDLTKIAITFIPVSDTLEFKYVWGSEEYPLYTCSPFNDAFGFIISGPGFNGPFENGGENIALIPGTDLPVAINNLNDGEVGDAGFLFNCIPPNGSLDFSDFFHDNTIANTPPIYNGITVGLTARAVVVPCETYTIKLMVADYNDLALDSGVFLEANSFSTRGGLNVAINAGNINSIIAESCNEGDITFSLSSPQSTDFIIDYDIFGTAVNGVDYEEILDNIVIPAGDTILTIPIVPIEDELLEPRESISFSIQTNDCRRDTFTIFIEDNNLQAPVLDDITLCDVGTNTVDGTSPTNIPPNINLTNEENVSLSPARIVYSSDIEVVNASPLVVGPNTISSVCLNIEHSRIRDLDIFLRAPNGRIFEISTDNGGNGQNYTNTCFTPTATDSINTTLGAPFTGNWLPEQDWSRLWGLPTNGIWSLQIIDDTGFTEGTLLDWSITIENAYEIFYLWSPTDGVACPTCPETQITPNGPTTYTLSISDIYGCLAEESISFNTTEVQVVIVENISCHGENDGRILLEAIGLSSQYTYQLDTETNTNGLFENLPPGNYTINVDDGQGCISTVSVEIQDALPVEISSNITNSGCDDENEGAIELIITNGVAPFEVIWDHGDIGIFIDSLSVGNYAAEITDANNCVQDFAGVVVENALFQFDAVVENVSCAGNMDGRIDISTNSTNTLDYRWEGPNGFQSNNPTIENLATGQYDLLISDPDGCDFTSTYLIEEPLPLVLSIEVVDLVCIGNNDGSININAQNGVAPYLFSIDNGASFRTDAIFNGLGAGNYNILIQDTNGCEASIDTTILEPTPFFGIGNLNYEIRFGDSVALEVINSLPLNVFETITWTPSNTLSCDSCLRPIAKPDFTTNYNLVIEDSLGCTTSITANVIVDRSPKVYVPNAFSPNGDGVNDLLSIYTDKIIISEIKNFSVFNRWGAVVYNLTNLAIQDNNERIGWNGTFKGERMNTSVFVWTAEIELIDGSTVLYSGDVTLVR